MERIEIDILSEIGSPGVTAEKIRNTISAKPGAGEIFVRLNSAGGDYFEGLAIYNILQGAGRRVTVEIEGVAASAAAVIAMAGKVIQAWQDSWLMIHNASGGGNRELLARVNDQMRDIFARRTRQSPERITEMMNAETWIHAREAIQMGFCNRVLTARAAIAACATLNGYKNLPAALQENKHTLQTQWVAEVRRQKENGLRGGRAIQAIERDCPGLYAKLMAAWNA